MYDEIQLEKLNAEKQEALEKEQKSIRKDQLEKTGFAILKIKKLYDNYLLEAKEIENVSLINLLKPL